MPLLTSGKSTNVTMAKLLTLTRAKDSILVHVNEAHLIRFHADEDGGPVTKVYVSDSSFYVNETPEQIREMVLTVQRGKTS
jgi:hypothetical protein